MTDATGENQHTCPFCGQVFGVQDDLTDHFADKHGMTDF